MKLSARAAIVLSLASLVPLATQAQVSLTTLGTPYTQDFNALATSGTANPWADNTTIAGWYSQFTAVATNPTTYRADAGGSNAGAIYSWGTGTATERAFGSVGSGTPGNILNAVRLLNSTGSTITSLLVSFTGEQWRAGGCSPLPCTPVAQVLDFEYQVTPAGTITDANTPSTGWLSENALDFTSPIPGTSTAAALDGNAAANRLALSSTINLVVNAGDEVWLRWFDTNDANSDHGLGIDDLSITPQGGPPTPSLSIDDVSLSEGNGATNFTFTVTLAAPAPAGGVTFDIATADGTAQDGNPPTEDNDYVAQSLIGEFIPALSTTYNFTVVVNGDAVTEPNETFFVNVTNVVGTGVTVTDGQGQGTVVNDDLTLSYIHDVQGSGSATPIPATVVQVEGVVVGDYQATTQLSGFFLEEEDADHDANPATSEGVFVFCNTCPTAVAEGQRVRVTGTVSEFFGATEITASTAGAVVVTDAGNHLAEVTPATIDLPVGGVVDDFYEAREGMKVTFVDTLTVSEYFELARFGTIELYEGGRPRQFTETTTPSVAGYNAHLAALATRRVILDDDDNGQNVSLLDANGFQFIYPPVANGGFSVGTQGVDFFRGGDLVNGLTGVLDWSFAGATGTDAWRIRPTAANPVSFTVANPRPATPPVVGGAIRAVGMNLLNYFTTIDTTSSTSSGPCGPGGTLDCRGADSVAELNRQRERAAIVICTLNADVYGFGELENTTPSASITDLLGAVNALCGGAHPYAFANTGGTLGTDAIRVQIIYRTGILSPVGAPLSDLDPIHSRPPTAQTFDVVDATNPAFGQRFTVIANHFKSKGSSAGLPGDADAGDGAGASNATRTAQATRLLTWISSTVVPAAGDPDVLLLGDFNSYAAETPVMTLTSGGYTDLETALLGPAAYSYLFDGQLGHLDYAFSSASLTPQISGIGAWHINADEASLLDYNDEIKDVGESAFEEKPDGSALVPPRVLFQPASPYRASDHDPVLVGIFPIADLAITKTDSVPSVLQGGSTTYTIVASNAGPDSAPAATVADTIPAALTCNWTCAGSGGGICTAAGSGSINDSVNLPAGGSATYTLSCTVSLSASGTIANTATVSSANADPNLGNNSATDTDTVTVLPADLSIAKSDGSPTEIPGTAVTYLIVALNSGPNAVTGATVIDNFAGILSGCSTTCVGTGGGTCTAGPVSGNLNDTAVNLPVGASATYTATCTIAANATGSLVNTATVSSSLFDPNTANNTTTDTDTLVPTANLSITKTNGVTTVSPGQNTAYTIVAANAGPSDAPPATVADTFPAACTSANWTCVGSGGGTCTAAGSGNINESVGLPVGGSVTFTAICAVSPSATGTLSNTATVSSAAADPDASNNSATDSDTLSNVLFIDGFESGDTSQWSASAPLTFEAYATVDIAAGGAEAAFGYDFAAVQAGEVLAPTSIAFVTDAAGKPLFLVGARRTGANGQLELTLEEVGGVRSSWVRVGEVTQQVRLEWSAADLNSLGHLAVYLDGRLALWVEGYGGEAAPAGVQLLRAPTPRVPLAPMTR
ncbi:MAG: ExeM/NucH family extracellular endonuclease [Thermoanaerobaculia bacterium]